MSLPFHALMPRGKTKEQDQPTQPVRSVLGHSSGTQAQPHCPNLSYQSSWSPAFSPSGNRGSSKSWSEGHGQFRKWPFD